MVKEEEDNREVTTPGRTILIEDNPTEVAGNLEVEVEEVVITGAQSRGSLESLAEPQTRTGVTTAMSLDISLENVPRGIMAITTIGLNSTKLFQDFNVVSTTDVCSNASSSNGSSSSSDGSSFSPSANAEQQHDRSDSCYGTYERGDDADARCDCR